MLLLITSLIFLIVILIAYAVLTSSPGLTPAIFAGIHFGIDLVLIMGICSGLTFFYVNGDTRANSSAHKSQTPVGNDTEANPKLEFALKDLEVPINKELP